MRRNIVIFQSTSSCLSSVDPRMEKEGRIWSEKGNLFSLNISKDGVPQRLF